MNIHRNRARMRRSLARAPGWTPRRQALTSRSAWRSSTAAAQ